MIDHLRESVKLAAQQPGGDSAVAALGVAALGVSALAALALLGLLARGWRKATVAAVALAVSGWFGSVWVAVAMVRDGQRESLRLWYDRAAGVSALNAATARAEAGQTLLALAVLGVCAFCAALALGRVVFTFLRGNKLLRVALPGTLALLTGTLACGLARRIDLTYFEVECGAAFLCAEPVISGTVALTERLRTLLLAGALTATVGVLLLAPRLGSPTRSGLVCAVGVFVSGAVSWGATRSLRVDAAAPLPERRIARVSCAPALARADLVSEQKCSGCLKPHHGPVIEVRGALLTINGKPEPPEALSAERSRGFGHLLPVVLIDPRSDWRATIRSLAEIRDRYWRLADLALQEAAPRTINTQTAGTAELPAQCCCIRVELIEGDAPGDWDSALQRAAETGKLAVGPKSAPVDQ